MEAIIYDNYARGVRIPTMFLQAESVGGNAPTIPT